MDFESFNLYRALLDRVGSISDPVIVDLWLAALDRFSTNGDIEALFEACKYRRSMVSIDEFMFSPIYLGMDRNTTYPSVITACRELDGDTYTEAILKGSIGCVDCDTEFLSPTGWVRIADYTPEHEVAQYEPSSGVMSFTTPKTGLIKLPCNKFFHIQSKHGVDQMLSEEHKVLYRNKEHLEVTSAKELADAYNNSIGDWEGKFLTTFSYEPSSCLQLTTVELQLQVIFISSGLFLPNDERCVLRIKKEEKIERIRGLLKAANTSYEESVTKHGFTAFYFIPPLRQKTYCKNFWNASKEQRYIIFDELFNWYGLGNETQLAVTSKASADYLQYLGASLGFRSSMSSYTGSIYTLTFTSVTEVGLDSSIKAPIDKKKSVDGYKYCFEVETGFLVLRRNNNIFITGNSGKSTLANVMLARAIYKISCLRDPQATYGIQSKSSIVFTIQSVRATTAKKAVFDEFGQYINNSPYFNEIYPYDKSISSEMIFRENNIRIMPVSSSTTGAISMNVMGGVLDEVNFMQKIESSKSADADIEGGFDQAKRLYDTISRRRKSRFNQKGKLPGILFVVSSSRFPDDFTEVRAQYATSQGGSDDSIFVYSYAQWEAKSRDSFLPEEFRVQVGNETVKSKVLGDHEEATPGCLIINVPHDFYTIFVEDTDGAVRDFAGLTTLATNPFISYREKIPNAMALGTKAGYHNMFNLEQVDLSMGFPIPIKQFIRHDISSPRAVHIDLGLRNDAAGIVCAHAAGIKHVARYDAETGNTIQDVLPVVGIDFALRVVPPVNGEIEFALIRQFLVKLRDDYGIPIKYVTFDNFQSVDSRQILAKKGFIVGHQSVEKIEPYRTLRDTLYDDRLLLPQHDFLAAELASLEIQIKNNKAKVDHRANGGTKDVCDALCGAVCTVLSRRETWSAIPLGPLYQTELYGDAEAVKDIEFFATDKQTRYKPAENQIRRLKIRRVKSVRQ